MIKILFIGVTELKEKSVLQQNTDEKVLALAIKEFQKYEVIRILGKTEYLRLQDALIANETAGTPLSADDEELMDYVRDYLIYGALMYSIPKLHTKFTNKGMQMDSDINASLADPQNPRADYAFKMDAAKSALIDYLRDKADEPKCCGSQDDTSFNFTGMALPDNPKDVESAYNNRYYKL